MFEWLAPLAATGASYLPTVVLVWLAVFFGRTLLAGEAPLIERVARIHKPDLSMALCRYTRRLTMAWCAYFVIAALVTAAASLGFLRASVGVTLASVVLFLGEYWIRPWIFPGEYFPGLVQQIRDTLQVWRPRRRA